MVATVVLRSRDTIRAIRVLATRTVLAFIVVVPMAMTRLRVVLIARSTVATLFVCRVCHVIPSRIVPGVFSLCAVTTLAASGPAIWAMAGERRSA